MLYIKKERFCRVKKNPVPNKFKLVILNLFFYSGLVLFSFTAVILGVLFIFFASLARPRRVFLKRLRHTMIWYGRVVVYILPFPFIRIKYKDFWAKKESGPFIFICNHRSSSDPFLFAFLPCESIQIVNIWPFKLPFFGIFAKLAGYLSVREMSYDDFSQQVTRLLNDKVNVISFPEGTRARNNTLGQFYSSIFRVAFKTKCPIVPVCITGSENIPRRGSMLLRPGTIKIHRLSPLYWEDYKDLTPFTLKKKVRDIIERETVRMDTA